MFEDQSLVFILVESDADYSIKKPIEELASLKVCNYYR